MEVNLQGWETSPDAAAVKFNEISAIARGLSMDPSLTSSLGHKIAEPEAVATDDLAEGKRYRLGEHRSIENEETLVDNLLAVCSESLDVDEKVSGVFFSRRCSRCVRSLYACLQLIGACGDR